MNGFAAAGELDARVGDDGDMDPDVGPPVIMTVCMGRHFRAGGQAHEPAPAPGAAQLGEDPQNVRAGSKMLGRTHASADGVRLRTSGRDEAYRVIAGKGVRMRHPCRLRKAARLPLQGLGAESDRQAEEWSGEAHAVCPLWPTLVAGTGQTNAKAWEPPPHPRPKCPEGGCCFGATPIRKKVAQATHRLVLLTLLDDENAHAP